MGKIGETGPNNFVLDLLKLHVPSVAPNEPNNSISSSNAVPFALPVVHLIFSTDADQTMEQWKEWFSWWTQIDKDDCSVVTDLWETGTTRLSFTQVVVMFLFIYLLDLFPSFDDPPLIVSNIMLEEIFDPSPLWLPLSLLVDLAPTLIHCCMLSKVSKSANCLAMLLFVLVFTILECASCKLWSALKGFVFPSLVLMKIWGRRVSRTGKWPQVPQIFWIICWLGRGHK